MLTSLAVSQEQVEIVFAPLGHTLDPLAVLCISQYIFPNRNWCIKRYTNTTLFSTFYFLQQMDHNHSRSNVWPFRQYDGGDRYEEYVKKHVKKHVGKALLKKDKYLLTICDLRLRGCPLSDSFISICFRAERTCLYLMGREPRAESPVQRAHVYILWAESPGQRALCGEHIYITFVLGREPRAESTHLYSWAESPVQRAHDHILWAESPGQRALCQPVQRAQLHHIYFERV